jgi:hypothetical protein
MLGVLGLLTSWVLLAPALLVLYLRLGGHFFDWMAPIAGIAASAPMLGFCTVGGIALMAWSVAKLSRQQGEFDA